MAPWLSYSFLGVSLLGFIDATYLAVKHFTSSVIPCSITHGCEIVTTSAYAQIFGIPVALLGALYYLAIFVGIFVAIDRKDARLFTWTTRLTVLGLIASIWFVSVQIFILHAICQWCMISALTSTALFVLGYVVAPRLGKQQRDDHHDMTSG